MGYSTSIYAVDLEKLKAAVGSRDARLVRRLLPASKKKVQDPRVVQNRDGEIFLNGRLVSFEELLVELRRRKWKGTTFHYAEERGIRKGRWKKPCSLFYAVSNAMHHTQFEGYAMGFDWEDEDEITDEEAAAELVDGRVSQPDMGHQYGYGLEVLCGKIGTRLTVIEGKGGMLQALKLNTPLSKERSPVKLPKSKDDFPGVGHLTAAEVEREAKRLAGMDLSFPKDELIEEDRKVLLRSLQKAAKKKCGVVAFYY